MTQQIPIRANYVNGLAVGFQEFQQGSDTMNVSFMGTGTANANTYLDGSGVWSTVTASKVSGLAASATTDTTNANNITSGVISTSLLGSGTANSNTYLAGNKTWKVISTTLNSGVVAYDSRTTLKTMTPTDNDLIFVESLGIFKFYAGSTEPDDDESCFTTASGAWLLEVPHWDLIDSVMTYDQGIQDERIEDLELKVLSGNVINNLTSLAAVSQSTFTATVPGAAIGNGAYISPHAVLDPRISLYAYVSAADTVTVVVNNPSASAATLTTGTWKITVIK